jgi:uncharacterized protein (DUF1697 family)
MAKFIAFLRGINVGNIRIKMPDLKQAFEKMGFEGVATFLQTGNVVFQTEKEKAETKSILEKGLTETFHYEAFVFIYRFEQLADIVAAYPLPKEEGYHAYVIFVENAAVLEELLHLKENIGPEAAWIAAGKEVLYWKVKQGQTLETPFSKLLAKAKYKSSTTMRNINTLEKMLT